VKNYDTVDFENKKMWFQVIAYTVLLTGRIKSWIFPKNDKNIWVSNAAEILYDI